MSPELDKAASAALESTLRVVQDSNNPSLLGLRSMEETDSVRLGDPLYVDTLSFDMLVEYQPEAELEQLFAGPGRAVVAVEVNGEVRSWISFVEEDDQWKLTGFGESATAMSVDRAADIVREQEARLVHVPAFNTYLVRFADDDGVRLIPVGPTPIAEMKPNEVLRADEALERLAEHARKIDAEYGDEIRARRVVD
ncbi:MAG: hypothetical protein OEU90_08230 [Gammaproteobacteria bacterium]|nr:hypothetical protein [Gammaproteobacteria bacterium]